MKLMIQTGREFYAAILNILQTREESFGQVSDNLKMMKVVHKYSEVFRTIIPEGLPPKRSVDHQIEPTQIKKYQIDVYSNFLLKN